MTKNAQIWQTTIWMSDYDDQPMKFYGESITDLKEKVVDWIVENEPSVFGNAEPSYEITRRYNYSKASKESPIRIMQYHGETREITDGWVGIDGGVKDWSVYDCFTDAKQAALHLVAQKLIFRKGPDWKNIPVSEGVFPLYLVKTVTRVDDKLLLNDYLQRGWYLLAACRRRENLKKRGT